MPRRLALGVLASGEGTTLEALAEQASGGHVPARVVLVLSDRPYAPVLEKARRRGLATAVLPLRGTPPEKWTAQATQLLKDAGVELVVLAGFLSILPPSFTKAWKGRAVNIHPSLLPRYGGRGLYGDKVHAAVLASGDAETGATIHLVTEDVDGGPVLARQKVLIEAGDTPETLRVRVQAAERVALYSVIARFAEGEWPLPYRDAPGRDPSRRRDNDPLSGPSA
jgi:phosphoribosylglycinamide formyltransferase 1